MVLNSVCLFSQMRFETQAISLNQSNYSFTGNRAQPPNLLNTDWSGSSDDTDTSKTMGKLYDINEFMEWFVTYFPVPFGSYSRETSLLFGLTKYNAFNLRKGDTTDHVTQPSSISFFTYYTLNTQYKLVLSSNIMFNKNRYLWKTDVAYTHYPLEYYGIGNNTELEDQTNLNTTNFQFSTFFLFDTYKKWYIGPVYDYYNYYQVEFDREEGPLPSDSLSQIHNKGRQSGLGVKVLMEGRDNRLNAKKGWFVEGRLQRFSDALGSQFNYTYLRADVRYYTTPILKTTIASRVVTEAKYGHVPIQTLSFLGGDYSLRGIYYGRYRDNVALSVESELRFPIFWILGGTVFGGIGQVAPDYDALVFDQFHYTYGLGLRLTVDSKHDVNLRFDLGFSNDQTLFIMNFAEAF